MTYVLQAASSCDLIQKIVDISFKSSVMLLTQ